MNGFGRRDDTIQRPEAGRPTGSRFAGLGDRLAGAFSVSAHEPVEDQMEHQVQFDDSFSQDLAVGRFPIARQGYDCDAVDEHVYQLEMALSETRRELAELRGRDPRAEVAAEIERLGEQTSAILITAHDKANETVSLAEAQAQTCIADAASYAAALREEAKAEQRRAETENKSLRRERARLVQDMKKTAAALSSLASEAVTS